MFGYLGNDIMFEPVLAPTGNKKTLAFNYASHEVYTEKSILEFTGEGLAELELTFRFNEFFCVPKDKFDALVAAAQAHEALALYYENGDQEGDFVITEISRDITEQLPDGTPTNIEVTVKLKEYVEPEEMETTTVTTTAKTTTTASTATVSSETVSNKDAYSMSKIVRSS